MIAGVVPIANALLGDAVVIVIVVVSMRGAVVIVVELPTGLVGAAWDVPESAGIAVWLDPVVVAFDHSMLSDPAGASDSGSAAGVP